MRDSGSDPYGRGPRDPGSKLDAGKPIAGELILGFPNALTDVIDVCTAGAAKYTRHGFKHVPNARVRYLDAAMRHLLAYGRGEEHDLETGCRHVACAAWNLLAVLETTPVGAHCAPLDVSPEHETGALADAGEPAGVAP